MSEMNEKTARALARLDAASRCLGLDAAEAGAALAKFGATYSALIETTALDECERLGMIDAALSE